MEVGGRHNTMVEEQDLGHPGVDAALGFMDACRSGTGGLEVQEVSRNGVIRCWPSQDMARPLRNTTPAGPSVASERVCRCGPQPGTGPRTLDGVLRILSHAEGSRGEQQKCISSQCQDKIMYWSPVAQQWLVLGQPGFKEQFPTLEELATCRRRPGILRPFEFLATTASCTSSSHCVVCCAGCPLRVSGARVPILWF